MAQPGAGPADRSDDELMRRAAAGERRAFDELIERHHRRALDFAGRFCADAALARDAVQEGFLRLLRHAGRYRSEGRFTTFLFAVVRNAVRDSLRQQRRRREEPLDPDADGDVPGLAGGVTRPADPGSELERRRLGESLHTALASLPEELREAFVLSEITGLPYREIARVCGCPEGTVASRKHAAVQRLRRLLEEEGILR
jgi:RNA polymerase sigma-70 factor (ECF subfamily)